VPTSPVRRNVLAVSVLLGLLIPFAVIYVKEVNNTKVRGRKDIEDLTVPFLGEIPLDREKTEHADDPRVVVHEGNRDVMNEAFRVLRTNLGFLTSKEKGSVIMVTSFNPGSGKTFLTVNTGISLAIKGKSVLVIDGDLRRGSASAYVGSPKEGLSDYLVGKIDNIGEVIVADTLQPGLSFLPIGRIPPNPTELLETPRFRHLIDTVRNEYDYVFIDCPPIEIMADAQIVESVSDRTVFVVRAGLLERAMVPELEKLYQEKKYKNMSIILNGTEAGGRRYGYRYGYGYGYGHGYGKGYGYGNNTK
jgi:tyrosine-protein kinase Etk/Wzc